MLTSWNWLQDFVDLEGLDPLDVAERLTLAGLEVEGVQPRGEDLEGVVVGRVNAVAPHPNADRLRICTVFDGKTDLQVVCGAKNVAPGVRAPLATIGTTMPSGMKIKKSKLRGEPSFGMLCSASEIGLPDAVDGLLLLEDDLTAGQDIADALQMRDVVLDISLTPNRGDCLSMRGIAREIAVLLGRPLRETPPIPMNIETDQTGRNVLDALTVRVDAQMRCKRYAAARISGVNIGPSPRWMRRRLEAVGQRPLNNIVDATNYINLAFGQPIHAFDFHKLKGGSLIVRTAEKGETLTLLDETALTLDADDLVIADAEGPVALAGVMGGLESAVDENTTDIVIEVAHFDPAGVRRSARRAHHHTEASHRFERGVDATNIPRVAERAVQLVMATQPKDGNAQRDAEIIDLVYGAWPAQSIALSLRDLQRIIGVTYSADETRAALEGLGFVVSGVDDMTVEVPPRRQDIDRTIDLVEEVARVIGYDRLPNALPSGELGYAHRRRQNAPIEQKQQPIVAHARLDALQSLRDTLFARGAYEAVNWGIADANTDAVITGEAAPVRLKNPLSSNLSVMRTTLLGGLLHSVHYNLARRAPRVALFEIGQVFPAQTGERTESNRLAGVLAGERAQGWHSGSKTVDIWDITLWPCAVGRALQRPVALEPTHDSPVWLHPRAGARILVDGQAIGHVGEVHPDIATRLDLDSAVFAFEIELDTWLDIRPKNLQSTRMPRTVSVERDLAVSVDTAHSFREIQDAIDAFEHPLIAGWRLFDVYRGDKVAEGTQSLAFRVSYQHPTDALTDAEIDAAHAAFADHLNARVGAVRRA